MTSASVRAAQTLGVHRRDFLARAGLGFGNLALFSLLARESTSEAGWGRIASASEPISFRGPPARAKSVIWIFLTGGLSHLESFDPKPALNRYAGQTIGETPHADVLESPFVKKNVREVVAGLHPIEPKLYPLQIGYRPRGESGLEISDWFPEVGAQADDLAIVRSMWTTDTDHGAQLQFHTGRHVLDGQFPTIGAWAHYGLGVPSENLPRFVVLGNPIADCCGGIAAHGGSYLGPEHSGVPLAINPESPLPFARPEFNIPAAAQAADFALVQELDSLAQEQFPTDRQLAARIKSYELAFAMQAAVPEVVDLSHETAATQQMYGLGVTETDPFGRQCLVARRLVERGVGFVQLFHGHNGAAGTWDAHNSLKANHSRTCLEVDQPIAGLIRDLKQRGLLDETLVVLATEFGRTPGSEGADGRNHHPFGFSIVLAGGGTRGGIAHGATDELGFHAVVDRHYVTDLHATVLHLLGLNYRALEIPGRKRLDRDFGEPIQEILA